MRNDLTVVGSLFGGGGLGDVDLVYQSWVLLPGGAVGDAQASIIYNADTGEVAVEAPGGRELRSVTIESAAGIFTECPLPRKVVRGFDNEPDYCYIHGLQHREDPQSDLDLDNSWGFASYCWGNVARTGLSKDFVLNDLSVYGTVNIPGGGPHGESALGFGPVDLVYVHELSPGDANRDFSFDQLDIVQVLQAGKYLTGQPATWGEGDWNGATGRLRRQPAAGRWSLRPEGHRCCAHCGHVLDWTLCCGASARACRDCPGSCRAGVSDRCHMALAITSSIRHPLATFERTGTIQWLLMS